MVGTRGGPAAPGEPCWDLAWRLGPRLEALNSAEGRGRKRGGGQRRFLRAGGWDGRCRHSHTISWKGLGDGAGVGVKGRSPPADGIPGVSSPGRSVFGDGTGVLQSEVVRAGWSGGI